MCEQCDPLDVLWQYSRNLHLDQLKRPFPGALKILGVVLSFCPFHHIDVRIQPDGEKLLEHRRTELVPDQPSKCHWARNVLGLYETR